MSSSGLLQAAADNNDDDEGESFLFDNSSLKRSPNETTKLMILWLILVNNKLSN